MYSLSPSLGGEFQVTLQVPEVLDTYVFGAFFIHPEYGLTVIDNPLEVSV